MAALLEADPSSAWRIASRAISPCCPTSRRGAGGAKRLRCDAERLTARATPRERAHVAALRHWVDGEPDRAAAIWEQILDEHPRDILAFRLAHFVNFWLGRPDAMLASVARRRARIGARSCRATARSSAAAASRTRNAATTPRPKPRAAPRSPAIPATCGRRTAWRTCWRCRAAAAKASPGSTACSRTGKTPTICGIICGGTPRCSTWSAARPTRCWRCTTANSATSASQLTEAQPDLYIDVQNAASMLFRLQRHGVDVGDRWDGTGRQGRGADRRLPVGLHPAALDDGAGGDRRGTRRPSACWRRCARSRRGQAAPRRWSRATRCRSARRCWRTRRANTPRRRS